MTLLYDAAKAFQNLLDIEYDFLIARKGVTVPVRVVFHKSHFYHLAGLHYLTDIQLLRGDREKLFNRIILGEITDADIEKSHFYKKIESRLKELKNLESYFDSNTLVFKYNSITANFSLIKADYLLESKTEMMTTYTFLAKNADNNFFCKSFFPKDKQDYSFGQTNWSILLKKKINLINDEEIELFRHKNFTREANNQ